MGLDPKELSLDLGSGFVPKSISDFLTEISMIHDIPVKLSKLSDHIHVLEQEMKKVDAFKRELPLCMLLLNDAIAKLKEEVVQLKRREVEAVVMEEFMSLKGNSDAAGRAKKTADCSEKKNWMNSAQLWSTPIQFEANFDTVKIQDSSLLQQSTRQERNGGISRRSPSDHSESFNKKGGAVLPFKKRCEGSVKAEEEEEDWAVDGLSLSIPVGEVGSDNNSWRAKSVASDYVASEGGCSSEPQTKKQRRCWSQELHQLFVNALLQLGGAQAATPKQIREIMQVDGLTNDEVKSHLQKYRLHIRKLPPSSSSASPNCDWLRSGECSHLPTPNVPHSDSPEGPLNLGVSAKGASVTGGESMDEEEDVKSESHSWKGRLQKTTE